MQKSELGMKWFLSFCFFSAFLLLTTIIFPNNAHAEIDESAAIRVLIGEASNQGIVGMQAVAEVIRRRGSLKPFSAYHRKDLDSFVLAQGKKIYQNAKVAWLKSRYSNITKGATHYENVEAFGIPSWAKNMQIVVRINDHTFFKPARTKNRSLLRESVADKNSGAGSLNKNGVSYVGA